MKTLVTIIIGASVITLALLWYAKTIETSKKTSEPTPASLTQKTTPTTQQPITTIATGLRVPWALVFLPNNDLLVTERSGDVRIVRESSGLDQDVLLTINDVKELAEGGLMGMALHPDYPRKPYIYFYYTYAGSGNKSLNKLVRYTLRDEAFSDPKVLLDSVPAASNHDGGRIRFGPDGNLYITTGDSEAPSLAQDTNSLAGKILRITDEGKPVKGNPFAKGGGNPFVYSYGHRNPQGLAWDNNGNLWETEHGRSLPTGYDEVNLIQPGKNYGWPTIQGDKTQPGMVTPVINSGPTTTWAPAGAVFVGNSLFFGGLRGTTLYEAVINNNNVTELRKHLVGQFGRLRDVVLGPDGMLYVTTSNRDGRGLATSEDDRIFKIDPAKL